MQEAAFAVFIVASALVALTFLNPLFIWLLCIVRRPKEVLSSASHLPSVDLVIAVRNGQDVIEKKIRDSLALDYPPEKLRVIVFSDGSTDETAARASAAGDGRVIVRSSDEHIGKNAALNRAVEAGSGSVLAFTDADSRLRPDALGRLVRHFADESIGGVSGRKAIAAGRGGLGGPQVLYNAFASHIKMLECRTGSISTNDGTLYAIRRELYPSIPDAVTDDLFVCLAILRRRRRFIYEPAAVAEISPPSKDISHEVSRRRRIVSQSLKGIAIHREMLNPVAHGVPALSLLFNKVLRRTLPLLLAAVFLSSAVLAGRAPFMGVFFLAQAAFYGLGLLYGKAGAGGKAGAVASFFLYGNVGTLLGLWDFLRGREVARWDPV
jgi:cellulose synthase/poly-beta-1,6-N-acetylglucosamine synthase-like glycosyltransferase